MTRLRQVCAGQVRAFCFPKFAQGRIEFGTTVPPGATVIARGPERALRDYLSARARLCKPIGGGRRMPGADYLAVPGIPEADNQLVADQKLKDWVSWIAANAPESVRVLPR
jgi:hypothetical protein